MVLDVGCGIGRAAIPLTRFLSEKGRYEGFDIVPAGIDWCKDKISKRYNNFNFQLSNVYNKVYHPSGWLQSDESTFPYADESFDFVFLISVFTHILPPGMENYFCGNQPRHEDGGRCFITYFLFDDETEKLMRAGRSHDVSFRAQGGREVLRHGSPTTRDSDLLQRRLYTRAVSRERIGDQWSHPFRKLVRAIGRFERVPGHRRCQEREAR